MAETKITLKYLNYYLAVHVSKKNACFCELLPARAGREGGGTYLPFAHAMQGYFLFSNFILENKLIATGGLLSFPVYYTQLKQTETNRNKRMDGNKRLVQIAGILKQHKM